jgi:Flp pilus assembly protein TadB
MLNLLLNLRSWFFIMAVCVTLSCLGYGWYWHTQYTKMQANNAQLLQQLATCNSNQQLLESAVQRWKAAANRYDKQLKRKEALVAKENIESDKRIQAILQAHYSPDCSKAIAEGIQGTIKPQFIWNNNIP